MNRKKVLILFPLPHLEFSPTTLGMYDALSLFFEVTVFCPLPQDFKIENAEKRNIQYFHFNTKRPEKIKALPLFIFQKLKNLFYPANVLNELNIYDFVRYLEYKKTIKSIKLVYDEIIAVDIMLLYLSTSIFKNVHLLSLELNASELPLLKATDKNKIKSVVIQTPERYHYLFGDEKVKTFFVQNAPVFKPLPIPEKIKNSVLFNGTATPWFALYQCVNFIRRYPEFTLTIKGRVMEEDKENNIKQYGDLLTENKIILHTEYMKSDIMLQFMASYEIGFCFYDLNFPKINNFNYRTAPSGKMFAYFAAGVPVIGNRLEGLLIIEEFNAGLLIDDFEPTTIFNAVKKIQLNYNYYRENCLKAAQHYSFDKTVAPFIKYLAEGND